MSGCPALASYAQPWALHWLTGLWLVPDAARQWTSVWQSLGGDLFIAQGEPCQRDRSSSGPFQSSRLLYPAAQALPSGSSWSGVGWLGDGRGGERSISPGDHGPDRAQRLGTGQKWHQESCDGWVAKVSSSYDRGSDQTEGVAGARLLVRRGSACSRTRG